TGGAGGDSGVGTERCEVSGPVDAFVSLTPLGDAASVHIALAARAGGALVAARAVPADAYPTENIVVAGLSPDGVLSAPESVAAGGGVRHPGVRAEGSGYRVFFTGLSGMPSTLNLRTRGVGADGVPAGSSVDLLVAPDAEERLALAPSGADAVGLFLGIAPDPDMPAVPVHVPYGLALGADGSLVSGPTALAVAMDAQAGFRLATFDAGAVAAYRVDGVVYVASVDADGASLGAATAVSGGGASIGPVDLASSGAHGVVVFEERVSLSRSEIHLHTLGASGAPTGAERSV